MLVRIMYQVGTAWGYLVVADHYLVTKWYVTSGQPNQLQVSWLIMADHK